MPKANKTSRKITGRAKSLSKISKKRSAVSGGKKRPIEQYDHKDKTRVNNPPVGLVDSQTDKDAGKKTYRYDPHIDPALQFDSQRSQIEKIIDGGLAAETLGEVKAALKELKRRQEPYLNWAGKAERTSFEVPTVSLHVHERIDPKTIIQAVKKRNGSEPQFSFFETLDKNLPIREAIDFYKHSHNWSNRLIAGDSLVVMNSLLEKEGMAGQVQMIYIDPPYGIKYGSNFQPFVNKRDVKDGKDEDLTAEPEMVKAFRDTWELGIHSYLSYLRDRLLVAHELLNDSGSVFVQISDENLHYIRGLMDEVFKKKNFIGLITLKKTAYQASNTIANVADYIVWYANNMERVKVRPLFVSKLEMESIGLYKFVELKNGERRKMTEKELSGEIPLPTDARRYRLISLISQGYTESGSMPFRFNGVDYKPPKNCHWKTTTEGLESMVKGGRLVVSGDSLAWIGYIDDFPVSPFNNIWTDTMTGSFTDPKIYIVQTNTKISARCLLMTTDPGDLVLDPTCGSGTTAYVAEQWGRRWITCDTSRVAIALAKQRLMTAVFDYYELAHPEEGVGSGFKYKTVPHITLKSIANNEPPGQETLYDQPYVDNSRARVTGPFTVEAVPAPMVKPLAEVKDTGPADDSIGRSGATLRHSEWKDELFKTGIRGKSGQRIEFTRVETLAGTRYLNADAETKEATPQRVVVSFGPEHAPLEQRQVEAAIEEAHKLVPRPKIVIFAAFQFDPEAAKDIEETDWPGVTLLKAQMNTDLLTDDLKKKRSSNESFWLIGQPDIVVRTINEKDKPNRYQVELLGFDYYNTKTGAVESGGPEKIAIWMLDTDYDGRSLFPKQVFFPMAGDDEGWAKLARNLKAEIDEELIEKYRGTVSLDFEAGEHKKIAVKIVDDRGIESLRIMELL
ncbi:MAG: site-specific DNA-methyltransferase [Candidatus Zixiibacteriota bacterium]